jgi:F-type H+-transporting ATPase subunit a
LLEHPPNLFEFLPLDAPITTLIACAAIVLVLALLVRRDLGRGDFVIPEDRLTLRNFIEILLEGTVSLMRQVIGPEWPRWMPLVGTLGLFILISNLMGLVPFSANPTSFVETNLGWAVLSFLTYNYAGFRHHGPRYLGHLLMGPWALWPLTVPVEIISHLARMMSLTIRLTANMFADHTLIAMFLSFPVIHYFAPWLFMGLGLFVAFLQAFIFMFLTIIYIGQAVEEAH